MVKLLAIALALGAAANTATAVPPDPQVQLVAVNCLLPGAEDPIEIPATTGTVPAAVSECHARGGQVTGIARVVQKRYPPGRNN
jgi:hypothetical protein